MELALFSQSAISIHAPREGGDMLHSQPGVFPDISIHAPREGGDVVAPKKVAEAT